MKLYEPKKIEGKWQKVWAKAGVPKATGHKGKYYILDMFPYPSGDGLHVGHVENFTATDILARFKRFQGYDVLRPMGWDAFGLPAENFAIKTGIHPAKKTLQSIKNFKRQMQSVGLSYDWTREINASSPEYYRFTQWMFLFLYKNGLAYKKKAKVNWCEACHTVLANEQVIDGKCDRSGDIVIQKDLEQWFFKITDFVESTKSVTGKKISGLLSGLDTIDWPESTKAAQRHWIGRSVGAEVVFFVADTEEEVHVFTTRLDTIYGCTYVVLAPEHPLVAKLLNSPFPISHFQNKEEVKKYLEKTKKKTDLERTELNKDKTGVCLQGIEVVHPFTGERLPVYIADYVLGTYGTGAVMGVPAHDERDFAFAKKYHLPIRHTIAPSIEMRGVCTPQKNKKTTSRNCATAIVLNESSTKTLLLRRKKGGTLVFPGGGIENGETPEEAITREIREETGYQNFTVEALTIPILYGRGFKPHKGVNCFDSDNIFVARLIDEKKEEIAQDEHETHEVFWEDASKISGKVGVAEHHEFMWKVFSENTQVYTEDGIVYDSKEFSGLTSEEAREKMVAWLRKEKMGKKVVNYRLRDWLVSRQRYWGAPIPIIYCETCGAVPVPEKDLPVKLPTDVDFRPTGESPLVRSKSFHNVRCPKCGGKARRESDTLDTFVCSSWYYLRFADPKNTKVFASKKSLEKYLPVDFYMGGAEHTVLHLLYARFFTKALMKYDYLSFDEPFVKLRHQGMILAPDGNKMSKSKGNVINPDQMIAEFGADSLRLYEMFMGPIEEKKAWNTGSIIGVRRFLEKVWRLGERIKNQESLPVRQVGRIKNQDLESLVHRTIKKVTEDLEDLKFNTAISSLMILVNELEKEVNIQHSTFKILLTLLSPFAPHISEELWALSGEKKSIFLAPWPKYDVKKIVAETVNVAVQVNGKVRAVIAVASGTSDDDVKQQALAEQNVQTYLAGKTVRKVIYVPGKIVSIVVG
ncbi:MAG: class I tRNA ligase family protein [Candidatus Moranbacteria bacterium]|nr:class I tRNA ligase family protein [Candidatus Moranbacteria bacterium]